jgi:heme exporter protein B
MTAERRSMAGFNSVTALAVTILVLFGFALGPDAQAVRAAAAGALWLAALFAGVLAFNRSYQVELDNGALDPLLMYPGPWWTIFAGKLLANLLFVTLMLVVVVLACTILFSVQLGAGWMRQLCVFALGTFGIVILGTFYGAIASRSRTREVLLPLLLYPMLVPVLLASVSASRALLDGDVMGDATAWMGLLAAFDIIFLSATLLTFRYIMEV